ncbi:AraC-type DNA-binding protein [Pustulibacterium marinum]|uniref:AraC-type DNA-binding protein n=1 Tax=Pustulibacterium marinum TaxID=1224947 RepID=A0A1I7I9P1_9FLAO|nr:AraC family transcriptional regulator [Pustulibacterium marinum]SFU69641.1 AraC-type DNA-binding protein [Pustulibacterium marinum]
MDRIVTIDSVAKYNEIRGTKTEHNLISILDYERLKKPEVGKYNFGVYAILFKQSVCGDIKYGKQQYDYDEESLIFIAPGQIFEVENHREDTESKGKALIFHSDFIRGTELGKVIDDYSFFSYSFHEALHLSEKERDIILDIFGKIETELEHKTKDRLSKTFIVDYLKLFLNYTTRFYDRQFITRKQVNKGILEQFESLLKDYLKSDKPQNIGVPTVAYFADELHLSPNYFGDLIKKETGISALDHIQHKLIEIAKEKMFNIEKSISQIAQEIGFEYPQHFTRMFKKNVGISPKEYRNSLNT